MNPCRSPPPLLVSCVGQDAPGVALLADLRARGLLTHGVLRTEDSTAAVSIIFDQSGEVELPLVSFGIHSQITLVVLATTLKSSCCERLQYSCGPPTTRR